MDDFWIVISQARSFQSSHYPQLGSHLVSNDIDDEGADEGENILIPSIGSPSHGIVLHNDLRAHMLSIDPAVAHASKFPEYLDI
ncbi:hypothetical protein PVK06_025745 [Gossypium arboreum]|uniref:Uncharacterized protein n=1 Tax=Gossypium arboreum TaxID=29729 RepID=A0ABR0NVQ2_GOSAR|nr:hypothetical protein PVK06_025745 [Gossypium arboreum]